MVEIIRFATTLPVPWKNGAGTTRELWAKRDNDGGVLIRISIAEVSGAQAFSVFPQMDRVILQLDGPAMNLSIDGTAHRLSRKEPLAFRGEATSFCVVDGDGPATDLNLMCQRGRYRPMISKVDAKAGNPLRFGDIGQVAALLALDECRSTESMMEDFARYDLVVAHAPATITTDSDVSFVLLKAINVVKPDRCLRS